MAARTVRGVRQRFAASSVNYHGLRLLGPRLPRLAAGWMPWVGLDRYAPVDLPGPDWVRIRPTLAGVCGTDLALLTGRASAVLSPFASFPAVLGHEAVGEITELGSGVDGVAVGDRTVLDPLLGCIPRGLDPCRPCRDGQPGLCLRTDQGALAPGPMIGFCRDLPGAWSEEIVAHRSQLHAVPASLPDDVAVLVEPLSVALHAVLAAPPQAGERVLVIGGGTLGLCTAAALQLAAPGAAVTLVARHRAQRAAAERLGVTLADDALSAAVQHAGARRRRPLAGGDVLVGGFEQVYDAVGSGRSLDDAIRSAGPRGRVAVVGGPGVIGRLDWTLVWARELRVEGTYVYGREPSLPGSPHTMDQAMALLAAHPELGLGAIVTHRFGLADWRRAMAAALDRGRSQALKIVFQPGSVS